MSGSFVFHLDTQGGYLVSKSEEVSWTRESADEYIRDLKNSFFQHNVSRDYFISEVNRVKQELRSLGIYDSCVC